MGDTADARREPTRGGAGRALALFLLAQTVAVARPGVLVAVAYLAVFAVLPARRWPAYAFAGLAVLLVLSGPREGLWWAERGWGVLVAGCFVALTLRWPEAGFLSRALGAVGGGVLVVSGFAVAGVGGIEALDWQVSDRLVGGMRELVAAMEATREGDPLPSAVSETMFRAAEAQALVFPAMVGIESLATLGVAWWGYRRIVWSDPEGLGPLRSVRFNDHLVWVLIGGLLLVLLDLGSGPERLGWNAVAFMGALYVLRGVAVVTFLGGARSIGRVLLFAAALVLAPPVVIGGALMIGIGDTWLDLRARSRAQPA